MARAGPARALTALVAALAAAPFGAVSDAALSAATLAAEASAEGAGVQSSPGVAHGGARCAAREKPEQGAVLMELDRPYVLAKSFQVDRDPAKEWDVVVIPDENMTHSCSNYTGDGTTVFTRDGKLVLRVASPCSDGTCLNAPRIMSKESFLYGIYVFTVRLPKCHHLWPALWLLPNSSQGDGEYGFWPCSGEIDVLETVHEDSHGAFNLVTGFGSSGSAEGFCEAEPACNKCEAPAYCTSTTLEHPNESFYYVEDINCSTAGLHPSWADHTFVLSWQPRKLATWVDPHLVYDRRGRLVDIIPSGRTKRMRVWDRWDMELPSWKAYEHESTPTWLAVDEFMQKCFPGKHDSHAPFDKGFKIVMNIAVGGYGGAPCSWGSETCAQECGGAVGAEMIVSSVQVWERS